MKEVMTSCFALSLLVLEVPAARAQELLSNGNMNATSISTQTLETPTGWIVAAALGSAPLNDGASSETFANADAVDPGGQGVFFKAFFGSAPPAAAVTVHLYQDNPATPGIQYRLTGWVGAGQGYSGLIPASPTQSVLAIDFLNAVNSVIGGSSLDLRAAGLGTPNGNTFGYAPYMVSATAPAGTVSVRSRTSIIDGYNNTGDQAYVVDFFSLTVVSPPIPGDFDGDHDVDVQDYLTLSTHLFTNVSALTPAQSYLLGDMTYDKVINGNDLQGFRFAYDDANGVGAFAALTATIPEPSTGLLIAFGAGLFRRRRNVTLRRSPANEP